MTPERSGSEQPSTDEIEPRLPEGGAAIALIAMGVGLVGTAGLLWFVVQRYAESTPADLTWIVLGWGGTGVATIWLGSKGLRASGIYEKGVPESQPRFSEEFTFGKASVPFWARGILATFVLTGFGFVVGGLWLWSAGFAPIAVMPPDFYPIAAGFLVLFGLSNIGFVGTIYYLLHHRRFVLEVHDDGIYSRRPTSLQFRYVPIENVTDVAWDEGRASKSDIFTPSLQEATFSMNLYNHACAPAGFEGILDVEMHHRIDMATRGVVRVNDDENSAVHLFGTDHPERLADTIETARDLAT